MKPRSSEIERFWLNVERRADDECWPWTAGRIAQMGYGAFRGTRGTPTRKILYAHRFSWLVENGSIPKGAYVLHSCHNPICVNPAHLYLGTHAQNMRDMVASGRSEAISESNRRRKGERHPSGDYRRGEAHSGSKIDASDVAEIRRRATAGEPHRKIALDFPIGRSQIGNIVRGEAWV